MRHAGIGEGVERNFGELILIIIGGVSKRRPGLLLSVRWLYHVTFAFVGVVKHDLKFNKCIHSRVINCCSLIIDTPCCKIISLF